MSHTSQYRLAIREEGEHSIYAYFAEVGTMHDAKLIGTMSLQVAQLYPDAFEAFKGAMSIAVSHMVEQLTGHKVARMEDRQAPPAEKQKKL